MLIRLFVLFTIMLTFPAFAQEPETQIEVIKPFGLSMHGTPKYTAEDIHLDYANPNAPKGGTLKQAAIGTFDTLNPFAIKGKAAEGLDGLFYTRLMGRVWDEPFSLYPLIAKSADVPEDRSGIKFHLDERAVFHDGTPITADDVLFSHETLMEKGRPNQRRVYKLATPTKIDDRTIQFKFSDGYDQETFMIFAIMPVLSKKWWETRDFEETLLTPPPSTGPYKIVSVDPGRKITFERIPDHWAKDHLVNKGHHNFDQIVFEYYRDGDVALE
ncbi:MAG: ABC transporter substrate-binding protein, partial [Pseudomonadota bacterium]